MTVSKDLQRLILQNIIFVIVNLLININFLGLMFVLKLIWKTYTKLYTKLNLFFYTQNVGIIDGYFIHAIKQAVLQINTWNQRLNNSYQLPPAEKQDQISLA